MNELKKLQSYCINLWKNQELISAQVRYHDHKIKVKVEKKYEKAFSSLVKQIVSLVQFHIRKSLSNLKCLKGDEVIFQECIDEAFNNSLEECFYKLFVAKDFEGYVISVSGLKSVILHLYYQRKIVIRNGRYYNPVTNAFWHKEAGVWERNDGKEYSFFLHPGFDKIIS